MMHNFWAVQDSALARMHQVMFMKNLSMLGAALLISYFGAGPLSLDGRQKPRSEQRTRRLQPREAVIA
jgi:putative oxidoreductase